LKRLQRELSREEFPRIVANRQRPHESASQAAASASARAPIHLRHGEATGSSRSCVPPVKNKFGSGLMLAIPPWFAGRAFGVYTLLQRTHHLPLKNLY